MKTILFLSTLLIFGLVSCSTRNVAVQQVANQAEEGVVIDGVRWATRNVGSPGKFARDPESTGRLFTFEEAQNACPPGWRLPTAEELRSLLSAGGEWSTKGRVYGYTFGIEPNLLFLPAAGTQPPTRPVPRSLYLAANRPSRNVRLYVSPPSTPVGARRAVTTSGPRPVGVHGPYIRFVEPIPSPHFVNTHGFYWSSTTGSTALGAPFGRRLSLSSTNSSVDRSNPAHGFSVRCVSE